MKKPITNKDLREFGLCVGIIFPLLIGLIIPFVRGHSFAEWTLFVGIPLLITGILKPKLLHLPYKFWISLGYYLGRINSSLILGLVFIFILQPISFFMRSFGLRDIIFLFLFQLHSSGFLGPPTFLYPYIFGLRKKEKNKITELLF